MDPSTSNIITAEPTENYDGVSRVVLTRGPGYFGRCSARWQITPSDANTFVNTEGTFYMLRKNLILSYFSWLQCMDTVRLVLCIAWPRMSEYTPVYAIRKLYYLYVTSLPYLLYFSSYIFRRSSV